MNIRRWRGSYKDTTESRQFIAAADALMDMLKRLAEPKEVGQLLS
jgi:hypothetical protein